MVFGAVIWSPPQYPQVGPLHSQLVENIAVDWRIGQPEQESGTVQLARVNASLIEVWIWQLPFLCLGSLYPRSSQADGLCVDYARPTVSVYMIIGATVRKCIPDGKFMVQLFFQLICNDDVLLSLEPNILCIPHSKHHCSVCVIVTHYFSYFHWPRKLV